MHNDARRESKTARRVLIAAVVFSHAMVFLVTDRLLRSLPVDAGAVAWSHGLYYDYASRTITGQIPYRDFVVEYPILTFPLFLIPRLFTSNLGTYRQLFVGEMFLFDVWAIFLIAAHGVCREGNRRGAGPLLWYTVYVFVLCPLVIGRFELAPMALAFAAAHYWFSGRNGLGGAVAGVGALVKLFPGLVVALALTWELAQPRGRRPRLRGTLVFLISIAIGALAWLALGRAGVIQSIGYQTGRGIEIESLYGGALLLAANLAGCEVPIEFTFNAYHIAGSSGSWLSTISLPVQVLTLLLVVWRFRRSGMVDGVRYSGAAVLAFIVTCKVLSPQFLIWLFPFLAVLAGRKGSFARWLFLLGCLCTVLTYPGPGFGQVVAHQLGGTLLLNLRNALLLGLLVVLLWNVREGGGMRCGPRSLRAAIVGLPCVG